MKKKIKDNSLAKGRKRTLDARRANAREVEGKRADVFLYANLKKGFYHYDAYLSCAILRGQASLLGECVTTQRLRLVCWGDRNTPAMMEHDPDDPDAMRVHGELYSVDECTLAALDDFFEDGEVLYLRQSISVIRGEKEVKAFVWLVQGRPTNFLDLPALSEYTQREAALYSDPEFQPKVLELITGVDRQYFSLFWEKGRRFNHVWREALGEPANIAACSVKRSDFYLSHIPDVTWAVMMFKGIGWGIFLFTPFCVFVTLCNALGLVGYDLVGWLIEMVPEGVSPVIYLFEWLVSFPMFSVWSFLECLFYVYMTWARSLVSAPMLGNDDGAFPREEREKQFQHLAGFEFRTKIRGQTWVSGWFLGSPSYQDILQGNMLDFFSCVFFNQHYHDIVSSKAKDEIQSYVKRTKSVLGGGSPGYNPNLKFMKPTLDPLISEHHPLAFYFLTEGVLQMIWGFVFLKWWGFEEHWVGRLRYWYHPGPNKNDTSTDPPIVFYPGVGIGLCTYCNTFKPLIQHRPVVLFEMPCVSLRTRRGFDYYTNEEIVGAYEGVLKKHSWKGAHLVGHSFGSRIVAILVRERPKLIAETTMLDPVAFCGLDSQVCRNFLYEPYEDGRVYIVNREPHLVSALMRGFRWYDSILWPEALVHLKTPTTVVLSSDDQIVPITKIKSQLAEAGRDGVANINLVWLADCDHGGWQFDASLCSTVVHTILEPPHTPSVSGLHYILVTRGQGTRRRLVKRRRQPGLGYFGVDQ